MTTVPPPSTQPQVTVAPPSATAVQILSPPPAVAALPPGTVLEAVVKPTPRETSIDQKQQTVTLRTPQGDVTIRLPVQLPDNAKVALEILRTAQANQQTPQVNVRLITVDNQPAAQVLAQLARQTTADPRVVAQQPQTQLLRIPINDPQNPLLRAAALPPGTAWMPNGPTQLPLLGTVSALVVLGNPAVATPETLLTALSTSPNPPPNTQATLPATSQPASPQGLPVPGGTPAAVPAPLSLVTGGELSVRITSMTLPGAAPVNSLPASTPAVSPTPLPGTATSSLPISLPQAGPIITSAQGLPPAPPSPPPVVQTPPVLGTFTGTVVSMTAAGAPVIDTGTAQIQLNLRANVPVGTQMTLEITAHMEPRPGALPPPPVPASALPLSGPQGAMIGWPTLTESISVLQRTDPQAAQLLAQTIPDGGPRTAAAMISFAQAMRSGDARQWPGDSALRALERASPRGAHLASQLSEEIGALSSRARETGAEWRALPLPWNTDGQIDRIALITRREGDEDEDVKKKTGGGGQRFLINLELSRLGSMQLDGMFRKETRGFDVMIRTKTELPPQIRNDLTGIFAASNAAMGLKGGLTFQVVKKFADPTAGTLATDKGGLWA